MKSILHAVLGASIYLHAFITPIVSAAPVTPGNNAEPHSSVLMPYSETVSGVIPKLFPRVGPDNPIPIAPSVSSQAILLTEYFNELAEINRRLRTERFSLKDQQGVADFLQKLFDHLTLANQSNTPYLRHNFYLLLKELLNTVKKWKNVNVRHEVIITSMECLQQTKPPGEFAPLPYEDDIENLPRRIENNDTARVKDENWRQLIDFLLELEWTLEEANRQKFPYDAQHMRKILMDSIKAVEVLRKSKANGDIVLLMDKCLALIPSSHA
ncbi:hypothetical protein H0H93_000491 [Arthromyces matolae]|nr:hypothetical protein H0H93_000491 [Arthromyces matolae]